MPAKTFSETCAIIVAALSVIIFIAKLAEGDADLGWLSTAIWSFMYWIKP